MKKEIDDRIGEELKKCVLETIQRVREKSEKEQKPFHDRLLSKKILRASIFERSFSTSFWSRAN